MKYYKRGVSKSSSKRDTGKQKEEIPSLRANYFVELSQTAVRKRALLVKFLYLTLNCTWKYKIEVGECTKKTKWI